MGGGRACRPESCSIRVRCPFHGAAPVRASCGTRGPHSGRHPVSRGSNRVGAMHCPPQSSEAYAGPLLTTAVMRRAPAPTLPDYGAGSTEHSPIAQNRLRSHGFPVRQCIPSGEHAVPASCNHPAPSCPTAHKQKRHARACLQVANPHLSEQPFHPSQAFCPWTRCLSLRPPCLTRRRVVFGGPPSALPAADDLCAYSGREKGACDGLRRHPLIKPIFGTPWFP